MNSYVASEKYGVPRSTIIHRLYETRGAKQSKLGKPTAFSKDEETKIASSIHVMEKCGFPLTKKDVITMISTYVEMVLKHHLKIAYLEMIGFVVF